MLAALGINADSGNVGEVLKSFTGKRTTETEGGHFIQESYEDTLKRLEREKQQAAQRVNLEAESVLFFIDTKGHNFQEKMCRQCKKLFATTYLSVSCCSEVCRYKSLIAEGIVWNLTGKTDAERWNGRIPKTLSPEAYKAAMEAVERKMEEEAKEDETVPAVDPVVDVEIEEIEVEYQEVIASLEDGGDE
jgi:hypothetical protein